LINLLIPLTHGLFATIDDEDYDLVKDYKWCASKHDNGTFYAVTTVYNAGKGKMLYMHRLILDLKQGEVCDHINHNKLDNSKKNIRKVTNQQNQMNQLKQKKNVYIRV